MTSAERISSEERERRLIEGLRRNEREAMAAVYDAYGGIAMALAVRTLGRSSDAEDVVQESFLALWRQADRIEPARGIQSYLLTIVHNKAVDRLRRQGRRPESNLDLELNLPASTPDPEEAAASSLERARVRQALSSLPEEQRRTIEMTYFAGLTINEVAVRMSVPIGTVKSRLRLAMTHLRRSMEQS